MPETVTIAYKMDLTAGLVLNNAGIIAVKCFKTVKALRRIEA
jgi:hypothetical protein